MQVQLAFYKGEGNWIDKLIRWWTKSDYSHVELIVHDVWYSTSPRDGKLRQKAIVPKAGNWEYVDVDIDYNRFRQLYREYKGASYDYIGIILSEVIKLGIHRPSKLYCSEFCAMVLDYEHAQMSPGKLYKVIKDGSDNKQV